MVFTLDDQDTTLNITINGSALEQVSQFKYLGVTLTPSNDSSCEIKQRLMLASVVLGKLQRIWHDKYVAQKTKLRLVNALVYPVLLYSSAAWTIRKADQKKLEAFQMRCLG